MITVYPFKLNGDGKYDNDKYATLAGEIYLHGKLERENGYDLCGLKELPDKDRVYDCEVLMDTRVHKAKLFYWTVQAKAYNKTVTKHRGLVVAVDDSESMLTAQEEFENRSEFL